MSIHEWTREEARRRLDATTARLRAELDAEDRAERETEARLMRWRLYRWWAAIRDSMAVP